MKDHDKNKESPYLKYWDVNNLYGQTVSQKLFIEVFIASYNEESDEVYFLEVDVGNILKVASAS